MTTSEIAKMVEAMGFPFAYHFFPAGSVPPLPFICYYFTHTRPESADNVNWSSITTLNIELYENNKNFEDETAIETVLNLKGFSWAKEESYLSDEEMYETLYTMEVIING